ncbi:DUF2642 domain-containing protein [Neobacillus vireti]|uniref:DUF2642 domain-containing protein n=1 Tax=Neobacillus vireti LMG 21834 TaxID=1131730 RepID=A0AB94IGY9_9BACI|nr:DUF2642 domain-containing protein [Neobacillus vireti]ETI66377.1 hypothetical protein BAVI_22933 [Neobacillus vireti LMG 21834]KLT19872.1 hypothetical protein AA980_04795 [Neobacillus vireti]
MTETNFHQIAHELLNKDVEVITLRGDFSGRLINVGTDVIVLERRGRFRPVNLAIRIETIVLIYRAEPMPRGPFGFAPEEFEEEHHVESSDERKR